MKRKIITLLACFCVLGLTACDDSSSSTGSDEPYIDVYVSSVSDTSAPLISGTYGGEELDYVISSYPVILAARNTSGKELDEIINVAEEFGEKYDTSGFPQAGLFIRSDLDEETDESVVSAINDFLYTFDADVRDIIDGASQAVEFMDEYSSDTTEQQSRFGFSSSVLYQSQAENKLAFISADDNPSYEELSVFQEPLGISYTEDQLSKYYPTHSDSTGSGTIQDELEFTITCPQGAPAATLARYASDEDASIVPSTQASAAFAEGTSDFIIFDSVNGLKLASNNGDNYKLVRMVTFGNLYVVATGNDDDDTLDRSDYVLSYGEGNVPDLAFKAVYGA